MAGAKEETLGNAVKPPREERWWGEGSGRLSAAGSHAVTRGDKVGDGWTSEGLKVFVLFG